MKYYGLTDIGMCRAENQDAFAICPITAASPDRVLGVLCDGMGGVAGGKIASQMCVSHIKSAVCRVKSPTKHTLTSALAKANSAIFRAAKESGGAYERMGTTAVIVCATAKGLMILSVGDSRAYLLHGGCLTRLTRDHSYVQEELDKGNLTPCEARVHPYRNMITRAVGTKETVKGDLLSVPWEVGDRLLLCSDGLHGMVEEDEIREILSENQPIGMLAHELICAANSHGGEDNITALLLENTKENLPNA